MLDTVNLFYRGEVSPGNLDFLSSILGELCTSEKNGLITISGTLSNLKVRASKNHFSVSGSWAKFWNGNNVEPFTWDKVEACMKTIGNTLDLPVHLAQVQRIDIGYNIRTSQEPQVYFPYLHSFPYTPRRNFRNSLYFGSVTRNSTSLAFYDKKKETRNDRSSPTILGHLMRYEVRIAKREKLKVLNVYRVTDLINKDVQKNLVLFWKDCFQKIHKLPTGCIIHSTIQTDKDCRDAFIVENHSEYTQFIDKVAKANGLQNGNVSRAKRALRSMIDKFKTEDLPELVLELEEKVDTITRAHIEPLAEMRIAS